MHKDRVGTWELSCLTTVHVPTWSASGRRGAVADDARAREVGLRHSSCEADEQGGAIRCGAIRGGASRSGAGGAKGEAAQQNIEFGRVSQEYLARLEAET